jgi:ATP-dependent helicase/nuclease subunit A
MRDRIGRAIRARAASAPGGPDARLQRQVHLIEQAQVSTLHSFCARLLRQHFHLVGLDPAFSVMDAEEARLLRLEVGRELLQDRYELDEDGSFQRLVDAYAEGNDERLLRHVLRAHELLGSLVDPQAWLARARERLVEAAELPLNESGLGGELIDLLGRRLAALRERCESALALVTRLSHFPKYVEYLGVLLSGLRHWERVLEEEGPDTLATEMQELQLPRLPSVKSDTPNKDVAKAAVDAVLKEVKDGGWRDTLRFTADEWRTGMRAVVPHAHVLLGLIEQFAIRYRKAKDASRQLDFSDLERYALEVLRDPNTPGVHPSPTARAYHRLFKHVLVDEYQDINELQDAIIGLLSHECLWGNAVGGMQNAESDRRPHSAFSIQHSAFLPPNLFCVGDVKQSIYRFRLAEPQRFLQREQAFRVAGDRQHGQVIDLQANFRSRAPLLAAINGVFERLMTREAAEILYDQTHRLAPGKEYPSAQTGVGGPCFNGAPIELHVLPSKFGSGGGGGNSDSGDGAADADDFELDRAEREAVLVARRVHEIMGQSDGCPRMQVLDRDGQTYRPVRYRDIVILLRSMRYKADQYADVLRQAGVPVHAESGTGYFESVEVRDMLALLAVLDNQRQDIPLAAVLRSPIARLPAAEDGLARIRLAYSSRERPMPFHQAVVRYAAEQEDDLAALLRDFLRKLHDWRAAAHRRPLAETVWSIYEQTGYLAYVSGLSGGEQRVANLMYLYERAAQFGTFQRQGLGRFMEFLEQLREESDLGQPSVASEAEDVVRIMSVHRAKGLEFPVVILPDLGKAINLSDCQGAVLFDRELGLGMSVVDDEKQARYPSLASTLVQERLRRQSLAEELRVLYVAMTRAKEHLILVGTYGEEAPERWRGRWSDHRGPLPADTVLSGRCLVDWIGAVACCAPGECGEIIRCIPHGSAEVAQWQVPTRQRQPDDPADARRAALTRLEPLDPAPPPHADADEVIARLSFEYPYQRYAKLGAVRAVTAGEAEQPAHASEATAASPASRREPALPLPKFLAGDQATSPTDIGAATHLVLQHLDFSRPLDAADLDAQVAGMIDRRLLDEHAATLVDRGGIRWFVGTDVGQLLRANEGRLLRELPVYYAAESQWSDDNAGAAQPDALDRVMVRGRLDVLVPGDDGLTIVDFKTDAVGADAVAARVEHHRPQVEQYRRAVQAITGRPVARAYLVFLSAREIREV